MGGPYGILGLMTRALWACPRCGRTFANVNQTHTCAALGSIDEHFVRSNDEVRAIFDELRRHVEPVDVLAEKTRIAFHLRMSFAAFQPRSTWLAGHLVLARTATHAAVTHSEVYSPLNVLHAFRLFAMPDDDFLALLSEAREVGEQRHLRPPAPGD
jgi:hypothetical protein